MRYYYQTKVLTGTRLILALVLTILFNTSTFTQTLKTTSEINVPVVPIPVPGIIEAELSADRSNNIVIESTDDIIAPNYNLGYIEDGNFAMYFLDVAEEGLYSLFFRSATPNADSRIKILVDNNELFDSPLPKTGNWDYYLTHLCQNKIVLSPGSHVLKLLFYSDSAYVVNLNFMKLVKLEETSIDVPGIVEAEDFILTEGVEINYYNDGDDTLGYIGWTSDEDWVEYRLNAFETGKYLFEFRVTSPNPGDKFEIIVNGDKSAEVFIENTSGWDDYTILGAEVNLSSGINNVRLTFKGTNSFICSVEKIIISFLAPSANEQLQTQADFNLYPNPTSDILFLNLPETVSEYTIEIYDGSGKILYKIKNNVSKIIDIGHFPSGTYFVKIIHDKSFTVSKIRKI